MKKNIRGLIIILFTPIAVFAQIQPSFPVSANEIYFVSDTQQPMLVEKLVLKSNHNQKATSRYFCGYFKRTTPEFIYAGRCSRTGICKS